MSKKKGPPDEFRELSFSSYDEFAAELDHLEQARRAGSLASCGNWSAAQVFQHLARTMRASYDGFPFKAPWFVAGFGRAMKPFVFKMKMRPGFQMPPAAAAIMPDDTAEFDAELADLREQIARMDRGDRMDAPSPLFGHLGHERWKKMHLNHSAMHLGFLRSTQ